MTKIRFCLPFVVVLLFLTQKVFSNVLSPDAEILLNERIATIHPDGTMETVTHRIIKVNTYEGIERYKKLDITYNKDYDEIVVSKVLKLIPTDDGKYIPENQNVKTTSGITKQTGQVQDLPLLYLDTKTITMPIEKPGDIFEYEIIVRHFKPLIKNHFWNVHVFNDVMPVQKSIFTVSIPNVGAGLAPAFYYKAYNINLEPRVKTVEDPLGSAVENALTSKQKIYTWEKDNLPAISVTEGLNPTPDMLSRVVISSADKWEDIINWFNSIYEDKMTPDEKIQKKVQALIADSDPQKDVVRDFSPVASPHSTNNSTSAVTLTNPVNPVNNNLPISNPSSSHFQSLIRPLFDYVAYSMPFLGNELGKGAFIPRPASDVLTAHQGDCKDKVVLLSTMLRTIGLQAYPALLNSVSEIPIEDQLPMPYYFNHAIVYIPKQKDLEKDLWLDPTISSGRWNFVPLEDRGKTALILNNGNSKFIKITQ